MLTEEEMSEEAASEQETIVIDWSFVRTLAEDLDLDEYDDDVQSFLAEVQKKPLAEAEDKLQQAATLLLQDEVDFSPELQEMGIEPAEELIELFLAAGADPNQRNSFGDLPLHLAATYGYEDIVNMLLDAGADRSLHNAHGKQACDLAATPALVAKLMPKELRDPNAELVGIDGDLMMDDPNEPPLPDFIEDADCGEPDDDFFAPKHDCGCGEVH